MPGREWLDVYSQKQSRGAFHSVFPADYTGICCFRKSRASVIGEYLLQHNDLVPPRVASWIDFQEITGIFHSFSVTPAVIDACGDGYLCGHHGCSHSFSPVWAAWQPELLRFRLCHNTSDALFSCCRRQI